MENANNELLKKIIILFEKSIYRLIHKSEIEHELLSIDNNIIDNIGHYKVEIRRSLEKNKEEERLAAEAAEAAEEDVDEVDEVGEVDGKERKEKIKQESEKLFNEGKESYDKINEKSEEEKKEISKKDEKFKDFLQHEFIPYVPAAYFYEATYNGEKLEEMFDSIFSVEGASGKPVEDPVGGGQIRTLKKKRRRNKI